MSYSGDLSLLRFYLYFKSGIVIAFWLSSLLIFIETIICFVVKKRCHILINLILNDNYTKCYLVVNSFNAVEILMLLFYYFIQQYLSVFISKSSLVPFFNKFLIFWDERFAKVIKGSASYVWESNVKISFLKIWKKTVKWGYFAESKSAKK